ncbi:MAG: hypothetical protein ACI4JJ_04195 [Huintestinicola sp.]
MLICFGISWPISVYKSYKTRSAAGKSLVFTLVIITGYVAGIIGKFVNHNINYVLAVYFFNLIMVAIDLGLYFRNKSLDRKKEALESSVKAAHSFKADMPAMASANYYNS